MPESNFVDYVKIYCRSGKGGRGSMHLHRAKYQPNGGPDGGDGGRGGHIYLRGSHNYWTLLHLRYDRHVFAGHGGNGSKCLSHGKDGEDRYIEQVAVIGDRRKYVSAIIVPAFEALKEYARSKRIKFSDIEDLVQNSEIRRFIAERIERLQKGLAGFEKVKKFTLLPHEFTIEAGELTNTLKIRRAIINALYADQIEAMYV